MSQCQFLVFLLNDAWIERVQINRPCQASPCIWAPEAAKTRQTVLNLHTFGRACLLALTILHVLINHSFTVFYSPFLCSSLSLVLFLGEETIGNCFALDKWSTQWLVFVECVLPICLLLDKLTLFDGYGKTIAVPMLMQYFLIMCMPFCLFFLN